MNNDQEMSDVKAGNIEGLSVDGAIESKGFTFHYNNLERIAHVLGEQQRPDLDILIPLVDEALASYAQVQQRIKAVQALLDTRKLKIQDTDTDSGA